MGGLETERNYRGPRYRIYRNPTAYEASMGTTRLGLTYEADRSADFTRSEAAETVRELRKRGVTGIEVVEVRPSARARGHLRRVVGAKRNPYEPPIAVPVTEADSIYVHGAGRGA